MTAPSINANTVISNIHYNLSAWASGQSVSKGQRVASNGGAWQANTSGTTGGNAPSGSGSNYNDGSVTWKWLSNLDYTSFAAWFAALPATLTAPVAAYVWNNGVIVLQSMFHLQSISTSSTNTITICPAPGEGFRDNPTVATNPLRYNPAVGCSIGTVTLPYDCAIRVSTDNTYCYGLQVDGSKCGNGGIDVVSQSGSYVQSCIIQQVNRSNMYGAGYYADCVVICVSNTGNALLPLSAGFSMYNCTVVRPTDYTVNGPAFSHNYNQSTVRNCVVLGFTSSSSVGSVVGDHNACESSSAMPSGCTGTINVPLSAATFQCASVASGLDLRLVSGSGLIGAGANDPTDIPTKDDVIGQTRPSSGNWCIGAWEYLVAKVIKHRSYQMFG